jgi:general secretion pathway protein A
MDYFSVLNLNKEPFSNSPDPDFFYHSREHVDCLQKLELSLLLRRGLNVVIGEVGTGKTTLCRQVIRRFSQREEVDTHLILDPHFVDANEFLITVAKMFTGKKPPKSSNNWQVKEYIKQYLYRSGVDQNKTTILIIDEGQKIPVFCLEILREFLNYETNEYKLLQIVIFAQMEIEKIVQNHPNFADRINLYHYLKPLTFSDTRKMIKFRLEQSRGSGKRLELFSLPALTAVYRSTAGYPRKIINLCHQSVLTMIIQNRSSVGYFLVRSCARRVLHNESITWKRIFAAAAISVGVAIVIGVLLTSNQLRAYLPWGDLPETIVALPKEAAPQSTPAPEIETAIVQTQQPPAPKTSSPVAESTPQPTSPTVSENAAAPVTTEPAPAEALAAEPKRTAPEATVADTTIAKIPKKAPEQPPSAKSTYSHLLGKITVQRNDSLSRIIQRVYGSFNSKYFRSLILANPLIDDPDRLDVGQTIALPAIPARVRPRDRSMWWIQIGEKDTLDAAFVFLRSYPEQAPAVRLIPYWTSKSGTKFALVLRGLYATENAASLRLRQLPPEMSSEGKIISLWNEEAVFFADPFLVGRKR